MKNPLILCWIPCLLLLAGCGRREPVPPAENVLPQAEPAPAQAPDLPEDIPLCPDFLSTLDSSGDTLRSGSAGILFGKNVPAVLEFYTFQLPGNGWVLKEYVKEGAAYQLQFQQGSRFLRLHAGPAQGRDSGSELRLEWGSMEEVDTDAYAPEDEEEPAAEGEGESP